MQAQESVDRDIASTDVAARVGELFASQRANRWRMAGTNAGERIAMSGPFVCGGNWAYNGPTIADSSGTQTQVTLLLRWSGSAWQTVDRAAYCEGGGVPTAVYQKACQVT